MTATVTVQLCELNEECKVLRSGVLQSLRILDEEMRKEAKALDERRESLSVALTRVPNVKEGLNEILLNLARGRRRRLGKFQYGVRI